MPGLQLRLRTSRRDAVGAAQVGTRAPVKGVGQASPSVTRTFRATRTRRRRNESLPAQSARELG